MVFVNRDLWEGGGITKEMTGSQVSVMIIDWYLGQIFSVFPVDCYHCRHDAEDRARIYSGGRRSFF